jgi:hypothetical protein
LNDRINEQKYVKLDFTSINKFGFNDLNNDENGGGIIIIKDENATPTPIKKNTSQNEDEDYEMEMEKPTFGYLDEKLKLNDFDDSFPNHYENNVNSFESEKKFSNKRFKKFSLFNDANNNGPNASESDKKAFNLLYSKPNQLKSSNKKNLDKMMKKSSSFNKSSDSSTTNSINDIKQEKESLFLVNQPNNSKEKTDDFLLTKIDDNSTKLDSSSNSSLNEASTLIQNKMVTFGQMSINTGTNRSNNNKKIQQSITTINTTSNITASTSATGSTSTNVSATSPTASSNNDEFSNNSSTEIGNLTSTSNTATKYSYVKKIKNNFSFHVNNDIDSRNNKDMSIIRSPKRFINSTSSNKVVGTTASPKLSNYNQLTPSLVNSNSSSMNRISSDLVENKYLNKLCEEIEVSLNVDCECADDYSSNDFSGDYSFDTGPRSPGYLQHTNGVYRANPKPINSDIYNNQNSQTNKDQQQPASNNNVNISHFTELRKNFEQNIKNQLRGHSNGTNNHETNNNNKGKNSGENNQNLHIKNHFGVLV